MARRKPPPTRRERLHDLFDSTLGRVLARGVIAALVFLLAGIVMRQARAYTYRLDDFRVHEEEVNFVGLPDWADAQMQWALQPEMFPDFSISIYDPTAESAVRAHAERHPFVREVESVRVLYPNRAEVTARLRVPVARVRVWFAAPGNTMTQRWRLLSDDGCLLPEAPYKTYLARLPYDLPVVSGLTERAPQDPGEVWEDGSGRVAEGIAAAGLAARIYRDFAGRVAVVRVDVSRFPATPTTRAAGEVRLVISCPPKAGGARIERTVEWGRTDRARAEVTWEDGYHTKFKRLEAILTSKAPPAFIDVRYKHRLGGDSRTAR